MVCSREYELIIIGAGPAGLSCALEAARLRIKTLVLDENFRPGGQLFCQTHKFFGSKEHKASIRGFDIAKMLLSEIRKTGYVEVILGATVYGINDGLEVFFAKVDSKLKRLKAKDLILATGAMERSIFFKGWTLPGVMTAGAVQNMMNVDRVLPGKDVLVIGSGNVGLIVAYQLLQAGAEVEAVIEALPKVKGYSVHAAKIRRMGVPIITSYTIKEAVGNNCVSKAIISPVKDSNGRDRELSICCDLICIATGLKPSDELCWQLGLKFRYDAAKGGFIPYHDGNMQTSIEDVYVAGDVSGVEEASTAMEEGRLAAISIGKKRGYLEKEEADRMIADALKNLEDLRL